MNYERGEGISRSETEHEKIMQGKYEQNVFYINV